MEENKTTCNNVDGNQDVQKEATEIKELIMRAVSDEEFKALLVNEPDKAMEGYNLTEVQKLLIKTLTQDDIDKLTPENLEEYFSADSAVYTPDIESEIEVEQAKEDDI